MAAIAIDNYSEQASKINNAASTYSPLKPDELGGRVRSAFFYYKPTAAVAADKVIALTKLPKGARILGGKVLSNAFEATADLDIGLAAADTTGEYETGTADSGNLFADDLDVATAGAYDFANTIALKQGYVTTKEVWLIATLQTAGMDGSADVLQGYVEYVVD